MGRSTRLFHSLNTILPLFQPPDTLCTICVYFVLLYCILNEPDPDQGNIIQNIRTVHCQAFMSNHCYDPWVSTPQSVPELPVTELWIVSHHLAFWIRVLNSYNDWPKHVHFIYCLTHWICRPNCQFKRYDNTLPIQRRPSYLDFSQLCFETCLHNTESALPWTELSQTCNHYQPFVQCNRH